MTPKTSQVITFTKLEEKTAFIRRMRLLADDLNELSSAIGTLVALSQRANDKTLLKALDKNPTFWNSVLASLSTTAFIIVGRIHDKDKNAYLKWILKELRARNYLSDLSLKFDGLLKAHSGLIKKVLRARNTVFGHSDFHRPMYLSSGMPGTWEEFAHYWRDLSNATKETERRMFSPGTNYGPQLNNKLLDEDISTANDQLAVIWD